MTTLFISKLKECRVGNEGERRVKSINHKNMTNGDVKI